MRRVMFVALLALLAPCPAQAQARLMLGAGLSRPLGDFGDVAEMGQHGRVGLQIGVPVFPMSLRGEGEFHRLPEPGGSENTNMIVGTLSAVLSLGGIGLSPYVLAGFGQYRIDSSTAEAVSNSGYHGGFGVSVGALGLGGFAELRVVSVSGTNGSNRYIPITVGLRF